MVVTEPAIVQIESRIVIGLTESTSSSWAKVAVLDLYIGISFPCGSAEGSNRFGLALADCLGTSPNYSRIKGFISLTVTYPPSIRCCYLEPVMILGIMKSMMMVGMWSLDVSFISIDRLTSVSLIFLPGLVGIILVETCFVFFFFWNEKSEKLNSEIRVFQWISAQNTHFWRFLGLIMTMRT